MSPLRQAFQIIMRLPERPGHALIIEEEAWQKAAEGIGALIKMEETRKKYRRGARKKGLLRADFTAHGRKIVKVKFRRAA